MVLDNQDRPFYKLDYIWELIPPELKNKFQLTCLNDMMKILEFFPHVFKMSTHPLFIQTRNKLSESFPSEKIVSLEILRVKRKCQKLLH